MDMPRLLAVLALALPLAAPAHAREPLEQAVAAAAPGATVRVPAGVHAVHLRLDKPITLVGEPGAILDGGGSGDVVRIGAARVAVRGLTLRRSGSDLTAMNAGIFVERQAREVTLEGNRIEESLFGVYLDGAADVRVAHNVIRGMRSLRVADRGDGIHLWNDTGCTIEGNDVAGSRDGIYVYVSPHNTIARNVVHDVRYGIHYMYSQHNLLLGNVSRGNLAGYALMSSDHLRVIGNTAEHEDSYGFLLNYISHSEIAGNQIRHVDGLRDTQGGLIDGTEGKGLFVYLSQFNTLHDNLVADSQIGIHVTAGSENNRLWGNRFVDNRIQVKYVQNLAQEWSADGRGNFWSDYLGWDLDADGIGDVPFRPNDGVDVLLWKYPTARNLMSSPAVLLMRYVQRAFPVFTPPSVQDSHPLMKAPTSFRPDHEPRD
ncbi:copper-binding protein [Rhodanobacter sp. FW510-R12]|uniref:nitrous oxide reductase family maturation protein NosD n=1 Tax=unclassified Rhodanobacter TaxID=2621553 RepID=UPI0007AA4A30|nr:MULTISPECIES: nitrous oxide reductase family maturation protein NosD [unclassified Rhodanobacter]KZC17848.1 copper-binding protein [Rhodanobacter sp. FW104-R8]KZC26072.1 copper-binding protein [Rhodanobacter sp. FW510-T8]KZC29525.1 copper-binding protein [Rhodanobacter sp. FW510-R10]